MALARYVMGRAKGMLVSEDIGDRKEPKSPRSFSKTCALVCIQFEGKPENCFG
jgi:hypothetical protein